ncbi:nuclear transport factor 2 family protein [Synechococcus sp. CCY 9618]|uniref:nuclear transport factor 2 family protein n=1 Tax=Synechococcus sp. CCY 9618 TaxID=2815602 RepID=UPI001C221527|nr:nuclear transport factor 2 family protein [Synechococcus sp. CCY 9618]
MHDVRQLEERLRVAMLASDVKELDVLIHDRLLFVGPDGGVYSKADDLALHRSGQETLTRIDLIDIQVALHDATAVAVVRTEMAGVFKGQPFEGCFRYIRTWLRSGEGWQVIAGSVCTAGP